jgi:hypothetical protein
VNTTYHDACILLLDHWNNQAPLPAIKHNVKQQQKQQQNNNKRIIGGKVQQYILFLIGFKKALPYFPVDNAHLMYNTHPVFSVLTNFFNRYRAPYVYRAPENAWNRTTGCGQARI